MRPISIGLLAVAALVVGSLVMAPDEVWGDAAKPSKTIGTEGTAKIIDAGTALRTIEVSPQQHEAPPDSTRSPNEAALAGVDWLASVQGNNGGWGQDGGETSFVRVGENLESNGNDLANTAAAVMALDPSWSYSRRRKAPRGGQARTGVRLAPSGGKPGRRSRGQLDHWHANPKKARPLHPDVSYREVAR